METVKYTQKNNTVFVDGNEYIDKLLYSLEVSSVLSETFKQKIINISLVIVTDLAFSRTMSKKEWVESQTHDLVEELRWVNIFSSDFISFINYNLKRGMNFEMDKLKVKS